ncbi:MAG: class I SAM-dependent methyltransferase [Pseudonocardiaceae bacterium]
MGVDPPPEGPFDLVHAHLLLVHVPQRDRALAAMTSVLRPEAGSWQRRRTRRCSRWCAPMRPARRSSWPTG